MQIRPEDVERHLDPFENVQFRSILAPELADGLLAWCENQAPWKYRKEPFYEVFEVNLATAKRTDLIESLLSRETLHEIRTFVSNYLGCTLDEHVDVGAHRMSPGFKMGIHTDYGNTKQSHRLFVQLNRGWSASYGGLLVLVDEERPKGPSPRHRYVVPMHGSGMMFEPSQKSYHAVSEVNEGERYTLCFSFYRAPQQ